MTEPASTPNNVDTHAPTLVQAIFIQRLRRFGLALFCSGLLLLLVAALLKSHSDHIALNQQHQITLVENRITHELQAWNTPNATAVEPLALKSLLALGQNVSQSSKNFAWFGGLHAQTLQTLLTQAIENLSRPVSGIGPDPQAQARQESQIRLETLPKLAQLKTHIEHGNNGLALLIGWLSALPLLAGLVMGFKWWSLQHTQALKQRIHMLNRAFSTQHENDTRLEGAHLALEGVLAALNKKQHAEHSDTLLQIGKQLEELKQSGRAVLDFAKSFHWLSAQGTQVVKTVLHSEQRNQEADHHINTMQTQLEGLRNDIRCAAQGLRKAGEVSRQLLSSLDHSEQTHHPLQHLVEQSQLALKESIEGLVMASKKINQGQFESQKLAEFMAVNQTAWANLLDQVEQYTESASRDSEEALRLAKRLIRSSNQQLTPPQTPNSPPQLLS